MVCERSSVGVLNADGESGKEDEGEGGVVLGKGVVVECGAVVEARVVGEGSVVEVGARVGRGAVVGKVSFDKYLFLCGLFCVIFLLKAEIRISSDLVFAPPFYSHYLSYFYPNSFSFPLLPPPPRKNPKTY